MWMPTLSQPMSYGPNKSALLYIVKVKRKHI